MNCYEQALKIYQTTIGKQNQSYGITLQNIGNVYKNKKEYVKALFNYKKAKNIYQKAITIGKNSFDYARLMNNFGVTYYYLDKYQTAVEYFAECVQIMIKTNNQKHPSFQTFKSNLQQMKQNLKMK